MRNESIIWSFTEEAFLKVKESNSKDSDYYNKSVKVKNTKMIKINLKVVTNKACKEDNADIYHLLKLDSLHKNI